MLPYMGLCLSCQSGSYAAWKWKKAIGSGELGTGAGRKNLNSVPYFDTNLLWDHRNIVTLFCLLLQPLPALFKHRLALYRPLSVQAA